MIKSLLLTFALFIYCTNLFSQVNELEKFRKDLTQFVNNDLGKIDSIPKNEENSKRLKQNVENSFKSFIMNKTSNDLNNLKSLAKKAGGTYYFDKYSYFFNDLRRDWLNKSLEDNVDYSISFYGLYDYNLPDFVSIFIQPFTVDKKKYLIYYYSLKKSGNYYIKDLTTDKIIYKGMALTSTVPIKSFNKIDENHFLIVEDMGDNGKRAFVAESVKNIWTQTESFKGNAFKENSTDFSKKEFMEKRSYLWIASNRSITTNFGSSYSDIFFNKNSVSVFYNKHNASSTDLIKTEAKWENNIFLIDDYYIGEKIDDQPMPKD